MSTAPERLVPQPARRPTRDRRAARHLSVVTAATPRRRRLSRGGVGVAVLIVVAAMFAVTACQAMLVQGQLRLDRLDDRVADEQARYERNRLRVAGLESPERIVTAARDQLGMVSPDEVVYLTPEAPLDSETSELPPGSHVASPDDDGAWEDVKPYLEGSP